MAGLEGTVTVPVAGKIPKKELLIGGVAVATLIVVYYVRSKSASSSSTSAAQAASQAASSTDQYPPDGTVGNPQDPYSTDPATGQTYGDEASGSGGTYGAFGTGASSDAYPWDGTYGNSSDPYSEDPSTGLTYGDEGYNGGGGGTTTGQNGPPFSTNAQWSAYVLQQQQALNPSASISSWEDALGLYLDGQPVSPAQKTIIFEAQAIAGDPPVAGANNYPPNVKLNGSKGGSTTKVKVPDEVGKKSDPASSDLTAAGFKVKFSPTRSSGVSYTVTSQSPKAGTDQNKGTTVTLNIKRDTPAKK